MNSADTTKAVLISGEENKSERHQITTFATFLRENTERKLATILAGKGIKDKERLREIMLRHYFPPPKWVLLVATEVYSVKLPTIPKKIIFANLKLFHWLFYEADFSNPNISPPEIDFPINPDVYLLILFGHAEAHAQKMNSEIDHLIQEFENPETRGKLELVKAESIELQKESNAALFDYITKKAPENYFQMMETVVEAKKRTFDRTGQERTTRATPIYEKLLAEWETVEKMSGVAELCRFLDPILGKSGQEYKFDRIKKICKRMGIFRENSGDKVGG